MACEQINEYDGANGCDQNATCTDINFEFHGTANFVSGITKASYECPDGTEEGGIGNRVCLNADGVCLNADNRADNVDCENLDLGFECPCSAGFYGDDIDDGTRCFDVKECDADSVPFPR